MRAHARDWTDVRAAQAGDAAALARLLRSLSDELMPLAGALAGGDGDRLLGDCLSRVYERISQLRDPSAVIGWSRAILVRQFLDERRARLRRPTCTIEGIQVAGPAALGPEVMDLRDAVARLPRVDRALLVLHYWQRYTLVECAESLQVPVGTAKSRLNRALERLRKEMGDESGG